MDIKYKLIDVSRHNGTVDFSKVKSAGIDGVIIRAGYGNSTVDDCFHTNVKNAIKNGLHVGIYWFGYSYTVAQAEQEAKYCLSVIDNYKGNIDLPIYYDWEYDSYNYAKKQGVTVTKQLCSDMTDKFCSVVEQSGYFTGIYANVDYLTNFYTDYIKTRYAIWVAQWAEKCTYSGDYGIWQYGASTNKIDSPTVDGVSSTYVDKSYCYVDYPNIIKSLGLNGYTPQTTTANSKDVSLTTEELQALKNHITNLEDDLGTLSQIKEKL